MMDAYTAKRLERLKYYSSSYEIALIGPEGKQLVAYTSRRSRRGLLDVIFEAARGKAIVAITGEEQFRIEKGAKLALGAWRIEFTGRTKRQAILEGELPFILDNIPAPQLSSSQESVDSVPVGIA